MKRPAILILCPALLLFGCSDQEPAAPPTPSTPPAPAAETPRPPTPVPADESGPVELKARWIEGKRYVEHVESTQRSALTSTVRSNAVPQTVSTSQNYAVDVLKGGPRTELNVEFLTFALQMSQAQQTFSYDSTKPISTTNQSSVSESLGKLVGQRLKFFATPSNTVDEIQGTEELATQLFTGAPSQARAILAGIINQDTLKHMVEIYHGLPAGPVSPGDSWPVELEFSLGPVGIAVLKATNTFTGWAEKESKRCALIKYKGTLHRKTDSAPAPLGGVPELHNGILKGQSWFDPELGTMLESVTEQSMSVVITFPTPQGASYPQIATNSSQTTVTHKLVEVQDIP